MKLFFYKSNAVTISSGFKHFSYPENTMLRFKDINPDLRFKMCFKGADCHGFKEAREQDPNADMDRSQE